MTTQPGQSSFGRVGGTTWPIYDGDVEWKLRYTSGANLSREQELHTASILSAYNHLTGPGSDVDATAALLRARRARTG